MQLVLCAFILSVPSPAPIDDSYAETVYSCDFEEAADTNFDSWPDHWTRLREPGFPSFLKVQIVEHGAIEGEAPGSGRSLRLELDGGGVVLFSPEIPVSPLYSYILGGRVKTQGLVHDAAYIELRFYDAHHKLLDSFVSKPCTHSTPWKEVRVGPIVRVSDEARLAVVGLHLQPRSALNADLWGAAQFDDLWLGRLPRMILSSNSPHNVYTRRDQVEVTCEVSGILEVERQLEFKLLDIDGRLLATETTRLVRTWDAEAEAETDVARDSQAAAGAENQRAFAGAASWRPPIPGEGFYRVQAAIRASSHVVLQRTTNLVVVRPQPPLDGGDFGWSLPRGEDKLPLKVLTDLMGEVGISWVKFPVWYSEEDDGRENQLAWFIDRLSMSGVELVGILDQPPGELRKQFGGQSRLPVASVFLEPDLWHPVVDPVMTRLSLKVRWWQLGRDEDTSFVGFPHLSEKIRDIKSHLERFGQGIHLGMGWQWLNESPDSSQAPWEFLSHTVNQSDPPLTADELTAQLAGRRAGEAKRWVSLRPLPSDTYSLETRAHDLVARILAAKMQQADAIFVADPFDPQCGLMTSEGTPSELFMPWRTTAVLTSGAEFIGSINLPAGSTNYIFARGDNAMMVVWNDHPVEEIIYLGDEDKVEQIDLWGRSSTPRVVRIKEGFRQVIPVSSRPSFIRGLNLPIARLRMQFAFDREQLSSSFGREQVASYRFKNFFPQGISGKVRLDTPSVWDVAPRHVSFKLAKGEEREESFRVLLRSDASSGEQPIRIDFHVTADQNYFFSIYRTMHVGLGDVLIELSSSFDAQGNLIVEQNLTNRSDRFVSFNCLLFTPDRPRQRKQIFNLVRGRNTSYFVLPAGEQLIGKTLWLRAEEIDGDRILNYQIAVER